jgi:hypothetical protein
MKGVRTIVTGAALVAAVSVGCTSAAPGGSGAGSPSAVSDSGSVSLGTPTQAPPVDAKADAVRVTVNDAGILAKDGSPFTFDQTADQHLDRTGKVVCRVVREMSDEDAAGLLAANWRIQNPADGVKIVDAFVGAYCPN